MRMLVGSVLGIALLFASPASVFAATQDGQGSVTVGGVVAGEAPTTAPVIESPFASQTFTEKHIKVTGTCLEGLVVKIFRNEMFAGSSLCQADKTFSLHIDLVDDQNDLVARQYDLLSQPSPESETVQVFYTSSQPKLTGDQSPQTAHFQLVIDYDYNFQGIFKNEPFNLPVHFIGGAAPYAISIDWGDGDTSVSSREDAGQFHATHIYQEAGAKTVQIRVSDSEGQAAFLQFVLIVNGEPVDALPVKGGIENQDVWRTVVFSSAATGVASFTAGFLLATFWETIHLKIRRPK